MANTVSIPRITNWHTTPKNVMSVQVMVQLGARLSALEQRMGTSPAGLPRSPTLTDLPVRVARLEAAVQVQWERDRMEVAVRVQCGGVCGGEHVCESGG